MKNWYPGWTWKCEWWALRLHKPFMKQELRQFLLISCSSIQFQLFFMYHICFSLFRSLVWTVMPNELNNFRLVEVEFCFFFFVLFDWGNEEETRNITNVSSRFTSIGKRTHFLIKMKHETWTEYEWPMENLEERVAKGERKR